MPVQIVDFNERYIMMKGVSEFICDKLNELDSCLMCMVSYCGTSKFYYWKEDKSVVIGQILECLHFWGEVSKFAWISITHQSIDNSLMEKMAKVGKTVSSIFNVQ